jgi:hypothetical protein
METALINRTYNESLKKADELVKLKNYDDALQLYIKALELKPGSEYPVLISEKLKNIIEVKKKITEKTAAYSYNKALQLAYKTILNATYGAFANKYFVLSNSKIANAITGMGRDLIRYMVVTSEDYFYNKWHLDVELHKLLGSEYIAKSTKDGKYYFLNKNYVKIDRPYPDFNTHEQGDILLSRKISLSMLKKVEGTVGDYELIYEYKLFDVDNVEQLDKNPKWIEDPETGVIFYAGSNSVTKYCDTDSVDKETNIITDNGNVTIEELYNRNLSSPAGDTLFGHESVKCNEKVLNWDENQKLYYANVKRIIRHKVSKSKWKLKTKTGKEIIVTNDHSMIVFRNGEKIEVKPCDVLKTDKILIIKN